jgi:two-component system, OmpR family, response regulator MprA
VQGNAAGRVAEVRTTDPGDGRPVGGPSRPPDPRILFPVRVLVVDDDAAVRQSLSTALGRDGYEVVAADGGNAALDLLASAGIDAIVLDVAMAEPNGLEVCRRVRAGGDRTPILMLTARDLVDDRVAGLDAGADDYLVKPFALAELRARLRALLRRSAPTADLLSHGDLVLDLAAARVRRGSREVPLTRTEYLLLELFLRNPGRVLSHTQIFQAVWGYDFGLRSNSLWVYMGYLRNKLEAGGEPRILHTVRGLGYVLRDPP